MLDIDREDLEEIMVGAQMHAWRRHWGAVRCGDIMSRDVVKVGPQATLGRYPIDWMLPPAGFVPAYDVAPTRP